MFMKQEFVVPQQLLEIRTKQLFSLESIYTTNQRKEKK